MNDHASAHFGNSTPETNASRGSGIRTAGGGVEPRPFHGTQRFHPRALIGRGGMGIVYRVHDVEMDLDVALKTLPAIDPADIVLLKDEFRALVELTHPNLIELHELVVDGDDAFFTMELLDGHSFVTHVRGREAKSANASSMPRGEWLERFTESLGQLVRGVTFLHRAGKLHCDIKPSNVRVTSSGRVVLLDFGLATAIVPDGLSNSNEGRGMLGTVEYMAPEQAWGDAISPAADWYAVGVMLYETLTGRLPFQGDVSELIMAKTQTKPRRPAEVVDGLPRPLSDLVMALLEPNPQKRGSGKDILGVLRDLGASGAANDVDSIAREAPFVGRETENSALYAAYEKGKSGSSPMLVRIEGPSGMGKTELVRRFVAELEAHSAAVVLRGRCHPRESVPYKAFDGVVDALSRWLSELPADDVPQLDPHHAGALFRVFRALSSVDGFVRRVDTDEPPEPQELRRRAFEGLGALLGSIAAKWPLVAWIDDLQWCDADSLFLLRELLLGVKAPLMILVGYRAEESDRNPILRELDRIAGALPPSASECIRIAPLGEASARALAAGILGRRGAADDALVATITAEAAGSPFFLAELARHAARSGEEGLSASESGARLADVVHARIERLRPEERRLLEVTSIAGGPIERSLALRVAGMGERGRLDAVRLGQACLLRSTEIEGRPAIETYHDRIREALIAYLGPEQQRQCHLDLASALREWPGADPEALFRHYLGGGDEREAGRYAFIAADRADGALAFDRAADLFQKALELEADTLPEWKLRMRLAEALTNAGRGADAANGFRAAADSAIASDDGRGSVLDLQRKAAEQFLRSGYNDEGMVMMREVLSHVGVEMPDTPARAMRAVALDRMRLLARGMGFTRREAHEIEAAALTRLDALWGFSTSISMMNHTLADALGVRHLLEALDLGERSRVARALGYEASFEAALGGRVFRWRAERMLRTVTSLAQETGNPYDEAWSHMAIGTSAWLGAEWARTVRHCDEGAKIFRQKCRGATWELAITDLYALSALSQLGKMRELGRRLPQALRDALAHGDLFAANNFRLGQMSVVWLARDEVDHALALAKEAEASWRASNYHTQRYHHIIGLTQATLYAGDAWQAFVRLSQEWPKLEAAQFLLLECPRVELRHLRARAALGALSLGKHDSRWPTSRLRKLCLDEARQIERAGIPTAKPFAAMIRAGVARLDGDRQRAEEALHDASIGFLRADMAMYREAAHWCLGETMGGHRGKALVDASRAWMEREEICKPEAMVAMLAPGCMGRA